MPKEKPSIYPPAPELGTSNCTPETVSSSEHSQLSPDSAMFLCLYDSLGPEEQEDIHNLLKKWADRKLGCKQLSEKLTTFHEEKQTRREDKKRDEASQRFKQALDRMPTAQAQLETIDRITRNLLKSVKQNDHAACSLLCESIRDAHFSVYDLNSAYQNYQVALVDAA